MALVARPYCLDDDFLKHRTAFAERSKCHKTTDVEPSFHIDSKHGLAPMPAPQKRLGTTSVTQQMHVLSRH